MKKIKKSWLKAAFICVVFSQQTIADQRLNVLANQAQATPQWKDFATGVEEAGARMQASLPERLKQDPRVVELSHRMLLAAIARVSLYATANLHDTPAFTPEIGLTHNLYQPNADTVYRSVMVDPQGVYRLRGNIGSISNFRLAQLAGDLIRTNIPSGPRSNHDFKRLKSAETGKFEVVISAEKPKDYQGDWWPMDSVTDKFLIRQVSLDWANELDPTIAIERLDRPAAGKPLKTEDMLKRLASLPEMIGNAATFFVNHMEQLREEGYINKMRVFDLSNMVGLEGQFYYEGAYQLAEGEALIVEAKVPESCGYWSLILMDDLYQTTDWVNNHSSLNAAQAVVDDDGVFRAVVSSKDPGVPNWLDTIGDKTGGIQGRWLDCSEHPIPTTRRVKLADVSNYFPVATEKVSLQQREAKIRQRREAFQQRPLW